MAGRLPGFTPMQMRTSSTTFVDAEVDAGAFDCHGENVLLFEHVRSGGHIRDTTTSEHRRYYFKHVFDGHLDSTIRVRAAGLGLVHDHRSWSEP